MRTPRPLPLRRWSDADHQALLRLADQRVGGEEIARRLNRTPSAIYSRAWLFDLTILGPTNEEKREAWLQEMTWARLASCHGEERASTIMAGRDPKTQADLARWNALGRQEAA